ncbi:MAG: hypothetical protein RBR73_06080 [Halothiobacillaceae bacterium]|nr:hypothetical protein [Halothiobacillaceae bacterium]
MSGPVKTCPATVPGWFLPLLLGVWGALIVALAPSVLPGKYFADAVHVAELTLSEANWREYGASYLYTARFYATLGLGGDAPAAAVAALGWLLSWGFMLHALHVGSAGALCRVPLWLWAVAAVWSVPLAIYLGQYSKEVPALLSLWAVFFLLGSARHGRVVTVLGWALAAVLIAGFALYFRIYWALVAGFAFVLWLVWRLRLGGWAALLGLLALFLLASWASAEWRCHFLSGYRVVEQINRLDDPDSVTLILNPWVNTSVFIDLFNSLVGWLRLMLPIELLAHAGPQHLAFALWQWVSLGLFVWAVRGQRLLWGGAGWENGHPAGADRPRPLHALHTGGEQARAAAVVAWIIGFGLVQGAFEPDFGSFVRHEAVLAPLLLYLVQRRVTMRRWG